MSNQEIYQAADTILDILHQKRAGNENRRLTYGEVLAATGIDRELFGAAYMYLRRSGYVMAPISEQEMWLTGKGMDYNSRGRTRDFLENLSNSMLKPNLLTPSSNVINIDGSVINSQIQLGTDHSSQTGSFTSIPIDELRSLLAELKESFPMLALSNDKRRETEAVIEAIETQVSSSLPNKGAIKKSLESLQRIFEGAAGSALGSGLVWKIAQFIAYMESA